MFLNLYRAFSLASRQVRDGSHDGRGARLGRRCDARRADLRGLRDAAQHHARRHRRPRRHALPTAAAAEGGPPLPHERRAGGRTHNQGGESAACVWCQPQQAA